MKDVLWFIMVVCVGWMGLFKIPIVLFQSGNPGYGIIVVLLCISWLLDMIIKWRTNND